jgi:hypothetical protein
VTNRIAIAALLMAITTPALGAEFYVGQNPQTNKCEVVTTKPDGQAMVMIGSASYATKDEAKSAKKAARECHDDN